MNPKEIELECLRLTSDGAGVGYYEGKATFVAGLLPGEIGQVQIFAEKKNWQRGKLLRIAKGTESSQRIDPLCTVFGSCGGCQLQHLNYEKTLLWKERWVVDNLTRIGKIDLAKVKIHPTLGMEEPWRYRNKARLHLGKNGELGYYQEKSNATVRFADCLLISEAMNQWVKEIEKALTGERHGIQNITLRENSLGKGMLILEPIQDKASTKEILKGLISGLSNEHKYRCIISIWGINASGKPELIWGDKDFTEEILGTEFRISPLAFLQVNPSQTRKLYSTVLKWAEPTSDKVVWDLYSGIGTITLALAAKGKRVLGIEENPYAVRDAILNAELNKASNVNYMAGKVEDALSKITEMPDIVVLDPPRSGVHPKVLEGLIKLQPEKIIYVSCDSGTLARDLGILQCGGYRVKEVQPVDMFGWTAHVESIIMMTYSGQKGN